jgi:Fe-S cluster assembly protein SufD
MPETADTRQTYLSSYQQFEKGDAGKRHPWLRELRQDAIARFERSGFPTTRDEGWRHTNVAPISKVPFRPSIHEFDGLTAPELGSFTFGEDDSCRLVFINGAYSEELSRTGALPAGTRVKNLAAAFDTERGLIEPHLARLASFENNPFVALNTAFIADGAFVHIPRGTVLDQVLHLVFLSNSRGEASVSFPRNLIVVGDDSQASIVESYGGLDHGSYFTNTVTEVVLGTNAFLDHCKLQRESEDSFHLGTLQVLQERSSRLFSHSISLGGALVRNDLNTVMNGEGCESTLNGLYVTRGRQLVDNHTCIDHARPNCESRELYKGILDDQSRGVFSGKIVVRKDAQKTSAKQTNKNLLLSEEALANTAPELQIFADDVRCTHGATIGHLDEEELFYTRSRGIGAEAARTLLTYAFASDILGSVKFKPIQCQIDLVLLTRLSRGAKLKI